MRPINLPPIVGADAIVVTFVSFSPVTPFTTGKVITTVFPAVTFTGVGAPITGTMFTVSANGTTGAGSAATGATAGTGSPIGPGNEPLHQPLVLAPLPRAAHATGPGCR